MESIISLQRTCKNCGNALSGRRGKKFCSDQCRTEAHNKEKTRSFHSPIVRNITNTIVRNRRILAKVLGDQATVKVTKIELVEMGFNFKYFTNTFSAPGDRTYFYCFDYGYMPLKDDLYLIVKLNK